MRDYNFDEIIKRLSRGDVKSVVFALGKRNAPNEYSNIKTNFIESCGALNVLVVDNNLSFSAYSRRTIQSIADEICGTIMGN